MNFLLSLNNLEFLGSWWLIGEWSIRIISLFVVPRNRKPSSGMAWLLLIFFFPLFGFLLFLILGNPKLPKSRRNAQKTLNRIIETTVGNMKIHHKANSIISAVPNKFEHIAKLSESLSQLPPFGGNSIEIIDDYDSIIHSIASEIANAKEFVHIEYFIIAMDKSTEPIFQAIDLAIKRGVIVKVLFDSFSTRKFHNYGPMVKRLRDAGATVIPMLPLKLPGMGYVRPDLRNHRKIVVIDGKIGYSGSQNLIQRNYHRKDDIYYDELVAKLQGPAVLQLGAIFLTDWYSETGNLLDYNKYTEIKDGDKLSGSSIVQILPSGPGYEDENNLKLFTSLIHSAKEKVVLVNPYFVPEDSLLVAITSASKRGVEVILINSEAKDQWLVAHAQRSFYEMLLKSGIKIFTYNKPILLHSKFIVIDDEIATVGSSNLDIRSFELDLEITVIIYDEKIAKILNKTANKYLNHSKEINLKVWQKRSRGKILLDNIARLTASLQ